jgi:hypothetical protein
MYHPAHRLDIVDADDVGTAGHAQRDKRRRTFETLVHR